MKLETLNPASLRIDPGDAVPIWKQIEDGLRLLVAGGALGPGSVVPSVRELSRQLRVNPATVSKAYQHLTTAGVLVVRRGEGTYVNDAPPDLSESERRDRLGRAALAYASLARTLGAGHHEILEELQRALETLASRHDEES